MSLDSVLYLAADPAPTEMEAALVRSRLFEPVAPYKTARKVAAPATLVTLFVHTAPFKIYEEVGISPKRVALFSCIDKDKTALWTETMIRALVILLKAFAGDALFLHAPDKPALMRKAGVVTLDPRCGLWGADVVPPVLKLIDMPYQFGIMPISQIRLT